LLWVRHLVTRIIDRYLAKQFLLASVAATSVCTGPIILISLFTKLPGDAIFSHLAWPALASIAPLIWYHALPLLVAAAVVWCYARLASESTLTILHSAGLSPWSVRVPILIVALGMTGVGFLLSCVVSPASARHLHDVLFTLRHEITPALLRPGEFNKIDNGRQVIFFDRYLNDHELADIFIRETLSGDEERSLVARRATLRADLNSAVLLDGSMQIFRPGKKEVRVVAFDAIGFPLLLSGGAPLTRSYVLVDELGPVSFMAARTDAFADEKAARSWMSEAANRFGFPPLTILHTVLGLELLALLSVMGRRQRQPVILVCAMLAAIHMAIVIAVEQISFDMQAGWLAAALIVAELVATGVLAATRCARTRSWPRIFPTPTRYRLVPGLSRTRVDDRIRPGGAAPHLAGH